MRLVGRGQAILEYAILIAVISAAFIAMALYVRRAVQGNLYQIEDRVTAKTKSSNPLVSPTLPPVVY